MRLLHYSGKPLGDVLSCGQDLRLASYAKPHGLWVSVEGSDDWPHWCQSEDFRVDSLRVVHEIVLGLDAKVLRLACVEELDAFAREFGAFDSTIPNTMFAIGHAIDWPRVAQKYQGIIIAPYIWERRLQAMWYYGWDCASGCIWDASAIASVALLVEVSR